jgi:hypothetical protein
MNLALSHPSNLQTTGPRQMRQPCSSREAAAPMAALLLLAAILQPCRAALGANLFANGDFEAGNTGFGSDLGYVAVPPFGADENGVYSIAQDPNTWFPIPDTWVSMGDHTTGSGNMLLATPIAGSDRVWYESANVTAGTSYLFSGWAAHVSMDDPNIASLSLNAGATSLGLFNLATLPLGTWGSFSFLFTPGADGAVVFSITDLALSSYGNDFVLDDLSLVAVPEPVSIAMLGAGAALFLNRSRRRCSHSGAGNRAELIR